MKFGTTTRYIPKGAVKVTDKLSDAVAYLSINSRGRPRATVYFGKQTKPALDYIYNTEAARNARVAEAFKARQETLAYKAKRQAERKAAGRGVEVGDILVTCWGYDQTNREFFEVTKLIGTKMVEVREIAQVREETGWERGNCVPQSGSYIGEPMRKLAVDGRVTIDDVRTARKWNTATVAGVPIGPKVGWTSYA